MPFDVSRVLDDEERLPYRGRGRNGTPARESHDHNGHIAPSFRGTEVHV